MKIEEQTIINNTQPPEILCVGQVLVDCIIKGWDPYTDASRVNNADSITLAPGGDAFNESVIFSRLGHKTMVMCQLGEDTPGLIFRDAFAREGILLPPQTDPAIQTPVSVLIVGEGGNRRSLLTPLHKKRQYEFDKSYLKGIKVLSLASLFRAPLTEPELILDVCRTAKKEGVIISADTKIAKDGTPVLEDFAPFMPYIDYIFPNEEESLHYTGKTSYNDRAEVFLSMGVKNVIIKCGQAGCYVKNAKEEFTVPSIPVEVADTTGAGDNLVAGTISSILRGKSLKEAVAFGTRCAAICIQHVGATTGVKDREQVECIK